MEIFSRLKNIFRRERPCVGLAMGGGGARGLAHLGILRVLESRSIPIDLIVGTSMGAIIGGAYAQNPNADEVFADLQQYFEERGDEQERITRKFGEASRGRLSRWANSFSRYYSLLKDLEKGSMLEGELLTHLVEALLEEEDIEETDLPFAAVAVDVVTGGVNILKKGGIRKAVTASASLPGVFPPVRIDSSLLVDGGVSRIVPVKEARSLGADIVIGLDVSRSLESDSVPTRGVDLLLRVNGITRHHLKQEHLDGADLVLSPDVEDFSWYEFARYVDIVDRGATAAQHAISQLEKIS